MTAAEKAIVSNTVKLLSVKPIDQISVTEICTEAGISKRTFYNYYKDKFDIIISTSSIPGLEIDESDNRMSLYIIEDYLSQRCDWLCEHKKFLMNISLYVGQNSPLFSFKKEINEFLISMIKTRISEELITNEIRFSVRFFIDGFINFVVAIIIEDDQFAKEFFARDKFMTNFIPKNIESFLYY